MDFIYSLKEKENFDFSKVKFMLLYEKYLENKVN